MQKHAVRGFVLLVFGAGACGVGPNVAGQLGATHLGDHTNAPAERADGRLALSQACGQPSPTATPYVFERTPYLQRVGAGSAELAWVSPADPDLSVVVSSINGGVLANPLAAKDPSATLGTSAAQWLAPISSLTANTVYCYDVKIGSSASERLGFRTAPAPETGAPVRFIAFGDSGGGGSDQTTLREQMETVPFDLMIHTGDIAYDDGTIGLRGTCSASTPTSSSTSRSSRRAAITSTTPRCGAFPRGVRPARERRAEATSAGTRSTGATSTSSRSTPSAPVRRKPRGSTRISRRTSCRGRSSTCTSRRTRRASTGATAALDALAPVLEKHKVQLVLAGHDHDYERMSPSTASPTWSPAAAARHAPGRHLELHGVQRRGHPLRVRDVGGDELALHAIDGLGQEFDSLVIRLF